MELPSITMKKSLFVVAAAVALVCLFQNCSKVNFSQDPSFGKLDVCENISCTLDPLTDKPAVTTILIALGDQDNNQLVVNGASSQLLAESIIRYSSPEKNPKILLVKDYNTAGEDPEDTTYIQQLLNRYDVTYIQEPASGITAADLQGYDLIWWNNPGHPMNSQASFDVLKNFSGAVVIQGDDLTVGQGFSMESLTGLKNIDNGTDVTCGANSYHIDNNTGEQYIVTLDSSKIPGADSSTLTFRYGNDIDNSSVSTSRSDLEILATAKPAPNDCVDSRPAIVRWTK